MIRDASIEQSADSGERCGPNHIEHCFHNFSGPLMMVLPDGCVHQKCCRCFVTRNIHRDHAWQDKAREWIKRHS